MTWRIIVTMRLTEDNGLLYNRVVRCLKACGINDQIGSGAWEGKAVKAEDAAKQMKELFVLLSEPRKSRGLGKLDHLHVYIDRASQKTSTTKVAA